MCTKDWVCMPMEGQYLFRISDGPTKTLVYYIKTCFPYWPYSLVQLPAIPRGFWLPVATLWGWINTLLCVHFPSNQSNFMLFISAPSVFARWWFRIINTFQPEQVMWNLICVGTMRNFHLKCMPSCYRVLSLNASLLPAFEVVFKDLYDYLLS